MDRDNQYRNAYSLDKKSPLQHKYEQQYNQYEQYSPSARNRPNPTV